MSIPRTTVNYGGSNFLCIQDTLDDPLNMTSKTVNDFGKVQVSFISYLS